MGSRSSYKTEQMRKWVLWSFIISFTKWVQFLSKWTGIVTLGVETETVRFRYFVGYYLQSETNKPPTLIVTKWECKFWELLPFKYHWDKLPIKYHRESGQSISLVIFCNLVRKVLESWIWWLVSFDSVQRTWIIEY